VLQAGAPAKKPSDALCHTLLLLRAGKQAITDYLGEVGYSGKRSFLAGGTGPGRGRAKQRGRPKPPGAARGAPGLAQAQQRAAFV